MQRRRLNVKFLAWMVGGSAVFCVGVYVLHELQMKWNAQKLLANVDTYIEDGELSRAKSALQQYVMLVPTDGGQRAILADVSLEIAAKPTDTFDQRRKNRIDAYNAVEAALRSFPDNVDLREKQARFCMELGLSTDAVTHAKKLVEAHPENGDYQALYCETLFRAKDNAEAVKRAKQIIGYGGEVFDTDQATAPENIEVYVLLARHLAIRKDDLEGADEVMDRLIEVNPQSADAFKSRGKYLLEVRSQLGDRTPEQLEQWLDEAGIDFERAREIDADDIDPILLGAQVKMRQKDVEGADELLDIAIAKHPGNPLGYRMKSELVRVPREGEDGIEKRREALAIIEEGLRMVSDDERHELLYQRVDSQLALGDVDAAKTSIVEMRRIAFLKKNFSVVVDFLDARLQMQKGEWIEAAEKFTAIRPELVIHRHPWAQRLAPQVDALLGTCYVRMGQHDLAHKAIQSAYDAGLRHEAVLRFIQQTKPRTGPPTESQLQSIVRRITALPPEDRDWSEFESHLAAIVAERPEDRPITPVQLALIRTDTYSRAKEYDLAEDILRAAIKQNREAEQLFFAYAMLKGIRGDHEAGLKFLAKTEDQFGDSGVLRTSKAGLLIMRNDKSLRKDLVALEAGVEKLDEKEQANFWQRMESHYGRARLSKDMLRIAEKLADDAPNDLIVQRRAFNVAMSIRDADGMRRALARIENTSSLGRNHSEWRFCEASRQVTLIAAGQRGKSAIKFAQELVDQVKQERPEWSDIHRLQAQIHMLQGHTRDTIASLEEANRYGRPDSRSIRTLHQLYLNTKQFEKARQLTDLLSPSQGGVIPLEQQARSLIARGDLKQGVVKAEEAVSADPENAKKHRWIADIYGLAKRHDRAEIALREAVKLAPENSNYWLALIRSLVKRQKTEEADLELRNAQIHLTDDQLPIVLAHASALLGRPQEAEQYFLMAYRTKPENLAIMQWLALHYLNSAYRGSDGRDKGNHYLKEMLSRAEQLPANDRYVRWARRAKGELLARSGIHRNVLQAMRLVEQNAVNGRLSREDDLIIAGFLSVQADAESHRRAIVSFEGADSKSPLSKQHALRLAQLYNQVGDWDNCRKVMYKLFGEHSNDLQIATTLCQMHLQRDELRNAEPPLKRLIALAPDQPTTMLLKASLLSKNGDRQEALATIRSMLPPDSASKRIRLERLGLLARRLEQMDEIDSAEHMHRRRVQIDSAAQLDLAAFYARQKDVKQAFKLLEDLAIATRDLPPVILVAVHAIRQSRDVIGDTYDARVQRWLDKALRENPDSDKLLFALSRFQEMQKKYAETEETYKRLIVHPDLGVRERAEVSNNLAFLLAVQGLRADDAMAYISEAIEVRGPTWALLDTRACVHIALGNYDDAIKDLQLSLLQLKDPGVYYHLAQALARSGDLSGARNAMGNARKNGLTANKLNPAERDGYKALNQKLQSGATAGAL